MSSSTRLTRWTAAAVVALALGLLPAITMAQATEYHANLSGSTAATGAFAATVDVATATVTVPTIEATTQAHIHAGAEGESGPVVVPLFAAEGASANSINVSGTFGVADLVGPYEGDLIGFVTAVNNGTLYVNVHTEANPAGEIRGQIVTGAAMTPPAPSTGNAGLSAAQASASTATVALLIAAAVALVLGGRTLTADPRTR